MMFLRTSEEKKSAIITIILFIVMLLVMSVAIFPPEIKEMEGSEGGGTIALNFGFDQEGRGDIFSSADPAVIPKQTIEIKRISSEILTSDNEDAVSIKDVPKKEISKKMNSLPKTSPPTEPQLDKNVTEAIGNLLSGDGNSDKNKTGNQGNSSGKLNEQGYQGDGGSGTGSGQGIGTGSGYGSGSGTGSGSGYGNYKLHGRKPLTMPAPEYKCNEEGTVVVEIAVDKNGKVTEVKPGVRGTTNMAECLVDIAKNAALQTKFDPSTTAPEKQTGTIIYNFKLKK